jgi:hypothetical protein
MDEPMFGGNPDPVAVFLSNNENEDLSPWSWEFNNLAVGIGGYSRPYFRLHVRYQNPRTDEGLEDRIQLCRRPGSDRPPLGFRVPTPRVPFDLIQSWLDFCQCHHGHDCSEGGTTTTQSLRVIDCEPTARRVVPFSPKPGKYTASSYVWGLLFGPSTHRHSWRREGCPQSSPERSKTPLLSR